MRTQDPPCYGCLKVLNASEFGRYECASLHLPTNSVGKRHRRCISCTLASKEALEYGTPWIPLSDGNEMMRCRKCRGIDSRHGVCDELPFQRRNVPERLCRSCSNKEGVQLFLENVSRHPTRAFSMIVLGFAWPLSNHSYEMLVN